MVRDFAIITWSGGWETRGGGHRGKSHIERRRVDVKFNTYGGEALLFHSFSQTRKVVVRRAMIIFAYFGIKLGKYQLQVFWSLPLLHISASLLAPARF